MHVCVAVCVQGPAPRVGVGGWLGVCHLTPRGLRSTHLNKLVALEGVVNRCASPHPRIHRAVYITEDALQHQQQLLLLQQQQNSTAPPIEVEREIHLRSFYDVSDLDKDIRDAQPPPQKGRTHRFRVWGVKFSGLGNSYPTHRHAMQCCQARTFSHHVLRFCVKYTGFSVHRLGFGVYAQTLRAGR